MRSELAHFEILYLEVHLEAWQSAWAASGRQPWAAPGYLDLIAPQGSRKAMAVGTTSHGAVITMPVIIQDVDAGIASGRPWREAVSPYGYGGPFARHTARIAAAELAEFFRRYELWAQQSSVVSTFLRYEVTTDRGPSYSASRKVAENVVMDLVADEDEMLRSYDRKVRKNVRRARSSGVDVVVDDTGSQVGSAEAVYRATMQRRGAGSDYLDLSRLFREVPSRVDSVLAHARWKGDVVSTELVLLSDAEAYSFLGGTLTEAYPVRPNDLLKHEIGLWAAGRGLRRYVLGGGASPGDGIFRYKRAFAPTGVVPFCIGTFVHDADAYADLSARHAQRSPGHLDASYFPAFRAPALPPPSEP